jgi:alkylation response protein AidB-like acyl-CoA dehydrogenase
MTTATYDPSNQTFIINTPETKAAKWWIGDLGVYCTHACVFAQLIIKNKKYGVHAFVVPIRDHKPYPGLEVGDIGPKMGFNCKDNGYIIFNNYRIPRENMLMKFHKVSPDGAYSKEGDEKITYATMLKIRAIIPKSVFFGISKGAVILTRFSLSRKQFKDNKGKEVPLLNYQLQQEKIFPRIAESFASLFAKNTVDELADFVFAEAKLHNRFNHLNETHTITSGVKAILTRDGLRGLEILRRAAGGHGYSSYSGIPQMIIEMTPSFTY